METREEYIRRFKKMSPEKKMNWLQDMHDFIDLASTEETIYIRAD